MNGSVDGLVDLSPAVVSWFRAFPDGITWWRHKAVDGALDDQ